MTLTGILSWKSHVTGRRYLRTLLAATNTALAESPAAWWSCTSCGMHINARSSLLTHVAGERHSRAVDLLCHRGRLDHVARPVICLRATNAAVHRADNDDAQFGRLLR